MPVGRLLRSSTYTHIYQKRAMCPYLSVEFKKGPHDASAIRKGVNQMICSCPRAIRKTYTTLLLLSVWSFVPVWSEKFGSDRRTGLLVRTPPQIMLF